MSVELSKEIWNELKRYVNTVDRDEAAETLVSVLIDNDVYADEIKDVFKNDSEVKRALAHLPNIHLLEKETLDVGDVTFIGATLWTDMNGEDPITLHAVKDMMNDFRGVTNANNMIQRKVPLYDNDNFETNEHGYVVRNVVGHKFKEEPAKFTPQDTVDDHKRAMDYINHVINNNPDHKYVVVGHHAPSRMSCHPMYANEHIMNGAFFTELGDFIAYRPQIRLWVHGHMHDPFDYVIGETRVVCNPRGYTGYEQRAQEFKLQYVEV